MSRKQPPQTNKRYATEFKSEAIKLAERLSVSEAAEESLLATENARLKRQLAEQDNPLRHQND